MKMIYFITALFFAAPLFAETLKDIEYKLPAVAKDWQETKTDSKEDKSTTAIYFPKGATESSMSQLFAVSILQEPPTGITDPEVFQKSLELQFGDKAVHVKSLDKSDNNMLLEWWVSEGDKEIVHGWVRIMNLTDHTAILTFNTEETEDLEKTRATWLPVLQDAKLVK